MADPALAAGRTRRRVLAGIWASPVVFLLHDLEEYLTIPGWLARSADALPAVLRGRIPDADSYLAAFALLFAAHLLLSWAFARAPGRGVPAVALAVALAARLWNPPLHLGQAVLLTGYVPGLLTAILLVAPLAAGLLAGMVRMGWLARRQLPWIAAAGLLVQFAAIASTLTVGRLLTGGG